MKKLKKELCKEQIKRHKSGLKVSSSGKVYTPARFVKRGKHGKEWLPEKELAQTSAGRGARYLIVRFNSKPYYVHRLVAECFCLKSKGKLEVNHKNKNTKDNNYTNLEWVTSSENHHHARIGKKRGVRRAGTKAVKWQAYFNLKNKFYHLGIFKNKEDAYKAYYDHYLKTLGVAPW